MIANQYSLSPEIIKDEVENAIAEVLLQRIRWLKDIKVGLLDKSIKIWYFKDDEVKIFPCERLSKQIIQKILLNIKNRLNAVFVREKYNMFSSYCGNLVKGVITKIEKDFILITISEPSVFAFYRLKDQHPKERGKYIIGQEYLFYVTSVLIIKEKSINRLRVYLSRNNSRFAELILEDVLKKYNIFDVIIKCKKRIAGGISFFNVSKKIPKEAIKEVSKILKERVKVKYVQ